MPESKRAAWRDLTPAILFGAAFLSAIALPTLAYRLTRVLPRGGFENALMAHVAWARVVGVVLACVGAYALYRLSRRSMRRAALQGAAILLVCAIAGVAAALPAYDAWTRARIEERYATAGWEPADGSSYLGPSFTRTIQLPAQEGPITMAFPTLEKGDHYWISLIYNDSTSASFFRTRIERAGDLCDSWEGQMPTSHPNAPEPVERKTQYLWKCEAVIGGPSTFQATWGGEGPVGVGAYALLTPLYSNVVLLRVDESAQIVAILGGLVAFVALAAGARRAPELDRRAIAAVAAGPLLVCLLWGAAALAPTEKDWLLPENARLTSAAFATIAALAAAGIVAALVALRRGAASPRDTLRAAAFIAFGLTILAPVAAARIWPDGIPWAVVGMLGSMIVILGTLLVADRLKTRSGGLASAT